MELRRQREALALAQIHQGLQSIADQSAAARAAAAPAPPEEGPIPSWHYRTLADLQVWEAHRQRELQAAFEALGKQLPEAEDRLREARATVEAMDLLGKRVARTAAIRKARKDDLAAAAEAANRPK